MPLSCRFYEQKFPEIDDVVMVNVTAIAEMGAYVRLLEYDNIEGMILLSELSRRRIRSIQKLIRIGRNECVVVLRVDREKGYIDLSKRRVSPDEATKCEEKFNKAKAVHSILRHVAETEKVDLEELYRASAWKLERKFGGPASSYDAFKLAITENPAIWDEIEMEPKLKASLISNVKRRLTPQPIKIRSDIEVGCYAYEGIDAVKAALRAGLALSTEALPVKINLIAPPLYVVTTTTLDKDRGIDLVQRTVAAIDAEIKRHDGWITVKMEARSVTESDDKELQALMEKFGQENEERAGDDSNSDEEEGMGGPADDAAAAAAADAAPAAAGGAAAAGGDDEEDEEDDDEEEADG